MSHLRQAGPGLIPFTPQVLSLAQTSVKTVQKVLNTALRVLDEDPQAALLLDLVGKMPLLISKQANKVGSAFV